MITREIILDKINSGSSLDYEDFMMMGDVNPHKENVTPLIFACYNNDYDLVKKIIKHGVDVNYENKNWVGWRALRYAFLYSSDDRILKLLLSQPDIDCCFKLVDGRDLIESVITSLSDPTRLKTSSANVSILLKSGRIPDSHIEKYKIRYLRAGINNFCEQILVSIVKNINFSKEDISVLYRAEFEDMMNFFAALKRVSKVKAMVKMGVDINGVGTSKDHATVGHNFFSISLKSNSPSNQANDMFDFLYKNNFDFYKENVFDNGTLPLSSTLDVLKEKFPDLLMKYNVYKDFEKLNKNIVVESNGGGIKNKQKI